MRKIILLSALLIAVGGISLTLWLIPNPLSSIRSKTIAASQERPEQWQVISTGVGEFFEQMQFVDKGHGWGRTAYNLWKTSDGGSTWEKVKTTDSVKIFSTPTKLTFTGLQFFTPSEGWVLEGDYLLHTNDGGLSWQKHEFGHGIVIRGFHFWDQSNGWCAGEWLRLPKNKEEVETWHGSVYATTDGGTTWKEEPVETKAEKQAYEAVNWGFHSVWAVGSQNVWIVGDELRHSENGGKTWAFVPLNESEGIYGNTVHIQFANPQVGWITTNYGGGYYLTTDGGKTWEPRYSPFKNGSYVGVLCLDANRAWIIADGIYRSNDGGKNWIKVFDGQYTTIGYSESNHIVYAAGKTIAIFKGF